ncbi:MAG: hypothetical protein EOP07_19885 [Proteobacteria bacterium]|nr:MAG: hypothetical protein EOP07_19885 [Pseudomonadota bacterium]
MKLVVRLSLLVTLALALVKTPEAQAFPEMIRKAYPTCTTCHVSPAGGGVLTQYGREISKDVLATWSREKENQFLHGAVTLPQNLLIGGDIRRIQTYVNTPQFKTGKWFLMQANVEAAVVTSKVTVAASADYDIGSPDDDGDDKWTSLKHYALVQISDEMSVRAGKFMKNFGLGMADHTVQTRRGIGWDEGSETYNAEFNYIAEKFSVIVTAIGGRPDDDDLVSEKGVSVAGSYYAEPTYKFGFSAFRGETDDNNKRSIFGPNWSLGFKKIYYWLGEFDLLNQQPEVGESTSGFASVNKFGMEIFRGADLYLIHESKKNDWESKYLDFIGYGPGFQWSPRPHFIFTGQWQKQLRPSQNKPRTFDSAYFVAQYSI